VSVADLARFLEEAQSAAPRARGNGASYHSTLKPPRLLEIYRLMYTSRRCDDLELALLKTGKAWFSISGAGTEACCAAAGLSLRPTDPMSPYYRDRTTCLARGVTPYEMFLQLVAAEEDPASGGHNMPAHWGHKKLAVIPQTSPTGSQCLPAQGLAEAIRKGAPFGVYPPDSVVYTSIGDAATNQGEFYETLKAATATRSPLVVHVIDNGWGISVPTYESFAREDVSQYFEGWPNLKLLKIDGTSVRESWDAFQEAVSHARSGRGPALVHSRVVRLYSHSASDDQKKYRLKSDIARDEERDPLPKFARELVAFGIATAGQLARINEEVDADLRRAQVQALEQPKTSPARLELSTVNYDKPRSIEQYRRRTEGRRSACAGKLLVMAEAINRAVEELMETDPRIVLWGEDIADLHRRYLLGHAEELEGKGGVFGVTRGLQRKFGPDRVWNSPLAEATIVGKAMGFALQGFLPIPEVQFRDFINPAWQQLVDEISTLSFRSNGNFTAPMVIRCASGGYLLGAGAIWHSEMGAGQIMSHPGLRVAVPSNARNAAAAMRGAIYCGDPVLFLEPKALYRRRGGYFDTPYPDFDTVAWPGEGAELYGEGDDLTIVTYGNTAPLCYEALGELAKQGVQARLLNLVWLEPLDVESIRRHADETGLVLIVEEDKRRCGAGTHIADAIYRDREMRRRVDVERLAAKNTRVSYGPVGEAAVLPQLPDIIRTAVELVRSIRS
jgi:2-oxoisovalerate dehydrogenase E1 component